MAEPIRKPALRRRSRAAPAPPRPAFLDAHLEDVLASLAHGVVVLDLDDAVVFMSPGAEDLTGVSARYAAARPVRAAFAAHPWVASAVATLRRGTQRRVREIGTFEGKFGRRLSAQLTATPILDPDGQVVGTSLLLRDASAQRAESSARDSRVEQLAAVAAGLAHEIKNPLGGIKGAAQILAGRGGGDPEAERFTSLITREVDRVSALLEQLLELTRPATPARAAVNVHRVLQEVLLLAGATTRGGLTVRPEFDPSLPEIWADEAMVRQVLLNLVKNALEAMRDAGTLTVATRMETDYHVRNPGHGRGRQFVSIEIADTGPGIPPEHLEHIFTPFFTTKNGGTGLGLAVSQRLVTLHDGMLRVESVPARGTRFRISLPVAARVAAD